jgi:hypothetical protein
VIVTDLEVDPFAGVPRYVCRRLVGVGRGDVSGETSGRQWRADVVVGEPTEDLSSTRLPPETARVVQRDVGCHSGAHGCERLPLRQTGEKRF